MFIKKLFRRHRERWLCREQSRRQGPKVSSETLKQLEVLEPRLAMSINTVLQIGGQPEDASGDVSSWVTVVADPGTDVFARHDGDRSSSLLLANNSSFRGTTAVQSNLQQDQAFDVSGFNSTVGGQRAYKTLRVYEGTPLKIGEARSQQYPSYGRNGDVIFTLPSVYVDTQVNSGQGPRGRLYVGENDEWAFTSTQRPFDANGFTFVNARTGVERTITATIGTTGNDDDDSTCMYIRFIGLEDEFDIGVEDRVTLDITYDADVSAFAFDPDLYVPVNAVDLLPAARGTITIPAITPVEGRTIVPGATVGVGRLSVLGETVDVSFTASPNMLEKGVSDNDDRYRLLFKQLDYRSPVNLGLTAAGMFWAGREEEYNEENTIHFNNNNTFRDAVSKSVNGVFNATTGEITLTTNQEFFGFEVTEVTTAYYDQAEPKATAFTLFSGFDHEAGLAVILPSPNSSVAIDSPINVVPITNPLSATESAALTVSLSASMIEVNSEVVATEGFRVPGQGQNELGDALAVASETIDINARVSTDQFDIYVTDRSDTSNPSRSRVYLSNSGLLGGAGGAAERVYIKAEDGDIIVDGRVNAQRHTYTLVSAAGVDSQFNAPFKLATGSFADGIGLIEGGDVLVNLGNDILGEAYNTVAESIVSLDTSIDSLRVRAASRRVDDAATPFPYELRVREVGDIRLESLAASSRVIDIRTEAAAPVDQPVDQESGDLVIASAIRSRGDLTFTVAGTYESTAPVETSFGQIRLTADAVVVSAGLRVLDTIADETRDDIIVTASGVDGIRIDGQVGGVNNINLNASGGGIVGRGLVTGDKLIASARAEVALNTDVYQADVRLVAPGLGGNLPAQGTTIALHNRRYLNAEIGAADNVVLVTDGTDAFLDDPSTLSTPDEERIERILSPALIAEIADVNNLFISAPKGSIDVEVTRSPMVEIGNFAPEFFEALNDSSRINLQGQEMLAAGSVSIVSPDAETISVYDSALAFSSAEKVRFSTADRMITSKRLSDNKLVDADVKMAYGISGFDRTELEFSLPVREMMKLFGVKMLAGHEIDSVAWDDLELRNRVLAEWGRSLRTSDRILVNGGATRVNNEELALNGVYFVADFSYEPYTYTLESIEGAAENGEPLTDSLMTITLVRDFSFDEASEIFEVHYVEVDDIGGSGVNRLVSQGPKVYEPDESVAAEKYTPIAVRKVDSGPGFTAVRAVTSGRISGGYDTKKEIEEKQAADPMEYGGVVPDGATGLIVSRVQEDIGDASELFGGVKLDRGDLVLVMFGVTDDQTPSQVPSAKTNGIYEVLHTGRAPNEFGLNGLPWKLVRYDGVDETGRGELDSVYTGLVAVNQGYLRTSATGEMFELAYDFINESDLSYELMERARDGGAGSIAAGQLYYQTKIDTGFEDGVVRLSVNQGTGGNTDRGTFGRMLGLLQENNVELTQRISIDFDTESIRAGGQAAVIHLEDALPAITMPLVINGGGVIVDGSSITKSSNGQDLRLQVEGRYFGPVRPSEVQFARRRLTRGDQVNVDVDGIVFREGSDGSILRNITIGGFEQGAAVRVQGANNVLIEGAVVGAAAEVVDVIGKRLENRDGIVVRGWSGKTGYGVTLRDISVYDATQAGIDLSGAEGVRVIEATVGAEDFGNNVGIVVGDPLIEHSYEITMPHHSIGVSNVVGRRRLFTETATLNSQSYDGKTWEIEVSSQLVADGLKDGLIAIDRARGLIWVVKEVAPVDAGAGSVVVVLELVDELFPNSSPVVPAGEQATWSAAIEFGVLLKATRESDLLESVYGGLDHRDLFLGQEVEILTPGAFSTQPAVRLLHSANSTVDGVDYDSAVIELTEKATANGYVFASFEAVQRRNDVAYNKTGIALSGPVKVVATDVRESLGTGIIIADIGVDLPQNSVSVIGLPIIEIGGEGVTDSLGWEQADSRNVAVYANRDAGIRVDSAVFREIGKEALVDYDPLIPGELSVEDSDMLRGTFSKVVRISGNFLGTNVDGDEGLGNGSGVIRNLVPGVIDSELPGLEKIASALFDGRDAENLSRYDHDQDVTFSELAINDTGRTGLSVFKLGKSPMALSSFSGSIMSGNGEAAVEKVKVEVVDGVMVFSGPSEAKVDRLRSTFDPATGTLTIRWLVAPTDKLTLNASYQEDTLVRYRALFRPEDFEPRVVDGQPVKTEYPELGTLDPEDSLDTAKMQALLSLLYRDRMDNRHGDVPKYRGGDDPSNTPRGSDDPPEEPFDDNRNDWWNDYPTPR